MDSGEISGVAAMKLRLAAPGCLLGGALGGLAEMRLGLLLAAPGCLLGKALDGWAAARQGYQKPHR